MIRRELKRKKESGTKKRNKKQKVGRKIINARRARKMGCTAADERKNIVFSEKR